MARKARRVKPNKGATKALAAMQSRYGVARGRQIFFAKASKFGRRGTAPSQKANSIYDMNSHRVGQVVRAKKR